MILTAPYLILPPERPAIVRAHDLAGIPSWAEMQRRERALREATFPFPFFVPAAAGGTSTYQTSPARSADSTAWSNYTYGYSYDAPLSANNYIQKFGIYSDTSNAGFKIKIIKRNSAGNYDVVYDQTVSHGGAGWQDFTLTTPYTIPASGTYCMAVFIPASCNVGYFTTGATYRMYVAGDMTGTGQSMTEEGLGAGCPCMRVNYGF